MRMKQSHNEGSHKHKQSQDIDSRLLEEDVTHHGGSGQLDGLVAGFDHHHDQGDHCEELALHRVGLE